MSKSQCAAWGRFASGETHIDRWGKPFTPNAYQAYSALSASWYTANNNVGTTPANPPATPYAGETATLTAQASADQIDFTISATPSANTVVELRIQLLRNANRKPSAGGYRTVAYATFTAALPTFSLPVSPGVHAAQYAFVDKATGERTNRIDIPVSGVSLSLQDGGADEAPAPVATPARKKAA